MVLTENTYLEPVFNWTEVETRVSGCHQCTEKLTSEGLGRSADQDGPIPYSIFELCQINAGPVPDPFHSGRMRRSLVPIGTIHATWLSNDLAKNVSAKAMPEDMITGRLTRHVM
jgi:hypothetical protein